MLRDLDTLIKKEYIPRWQGLVQENRKDIIENIIIVVEEHCEFYEQSVPVGLFPFIQLY